MPPKRKLKTDGDEVGAGAAAGSSTAANKKGKPTPTGGDADPPEVSGNASTTTTGQTLRRSTRVRAAPPSAPTPAPAPKTKSAKGKKGTAKGKVTATGKGKAKARTDAKGKGRATATESPSPSTSDAEDDDHEATAPSGTAGGSGTARPVGSAPKADEDNDEDSDEEGFEIAPSKKKKALPPKKKAAAAGKASGKAAAPAGPVEKRALPYRAECPQDVVDRHGRAMQQRFFMVDRRREGDELKEEFSVLGSTGNVYTVVVATKPKCDCPDARRGHHCKHILFIMRKVLQVPERSPMWWQKALLNSELETVFRNAPAAPNAVTNRRVQEAYLRATGKLAQDTDGAGASGSAGGAATKRKTMEEDDDCPICYETMFGVKEDKLVYCEECGNGLHDPCFAQWKLTSRNQGKALTCVWCRSPWAVPKDAAGAGAGKPGSGTGHGKVGRGNWFGANYINLGRDAGGYD